MRYVALCLKSLSAFWLALLCAASFAQAGNFSLTWGTAPYTWTANSLGPNTYTLTDQYGFQVQLRFTVTRANGASAGAFPDDLLTDGAGNTFGTQTSIWQVWNPNLSGGNIGGSTNVATLDILSGGVAQPVNGLNFRVSDIDAVDNNTNPPTNDRCDHLTFTGNAGNPTLAPVTGSPVFLIGPGAGAGSSPALAANQVQCNFQTSTGITSPTSNGDDNGSLTATYPNGTSTAVVNYDESIHNVHNNFTFNAAARGIGVWSATAFTVNNTISLDKTTTTTSYTAVGQVIPYVFTVTNNGPLPILTTQNMQIQDSRIGLISCGSPAANVPAGGTFVCNASYTVTAADVTAPAGITNTATAGIGTGAQTFATRLQSNADVVNVPNRVIDAVNDNFTAVAINSATGGTTASVFANDTLATVAFANAAVIPSITATGGLTGVTINSNGTLNVPAGTAAGTYTVTYRICDTAAPAVCDTATASVLVSTTPTGSGSTSCTGINLANNGGIETPVITAGGQALLAVNAVPGWSTNDTAIEVWSSGFNGVPSHTGAQFLEMNANIGTSILTQTPSAIQRRAELKIFWAHRGRAGTDTARLLVTDNGGGSTTSPNFSTGNTAWVVRSLTHVASATATSTSLAFDSISSAGGASLGNFIDTVEVCQTYLTIAKSFVSKTDVDASASDTAGDTVLYQYAIANPAGNQTGLAAISVVDDKIGSISANPPNSGDTNTNGFLDPGETWIKTASYTLTQADITATAVTNVAFAQGNTGANVIRSDNASVNVPLTAAPILLLDKSRVFLVDNGTIGFADVGDVIRYNYLVTNNGNVPITNVSVSDIHNATGVFPANPSGVILTDIAPTGDSSGTPGGIVWSSLAPKDRLTFTAQYTVNQVDFDTLRP